MRAIHPQRLVCRLAFASFALLLVAVTLPEGFELHYPVSDFVTANGVRLEGNPLQPDVEAPDPRRNEPDVARSTSSIAIPASWLSNAVF